jgi:hypothetical protein
VVRFAIVHEEFWTPTEIREAMDDARLGQHGGAEIGRGGHEVALRVSGMRLFCD